MFNNMQQQAKMAPTVNETDSLLSFVSSATVNIHEALGKQTKKRTVNIKKYAQKRVKRLEQGSSRRGNNTGSQQTKSKSAQLSPPSAKQLPSSARARSMIESSMSCPELCLPPSQPISAPQTFGVATTNYPTYSSHPPMQHSYSDPNINLPTTEASMIDDDDLAAILLSELHDVPTQPAVASRPASGSVTPCYTPQPTLESQVGLAEHPYSPYSDCGSDELYSDSAYSSPVGYSCSPAPMVSVPSAISSNHWTTSVQSPPMVMAQCSVACGNNSWMEMPESFHPDPLSTSCSWIRDCQPLTVTSTMPAVVDQGPPATPTVLQFLSEWGPLQ